MDSINSTETISRVWAAPWYRVRMDAFEVSFLPGAGEKLAEVCNVDAEIRLPDGSR
ncbi:MULTISPECIES: hypothetical protein [Streptomyces]|uniref:hypothetical protein n=1 Tax=Streptomyces TaxID=1883 RepID=UPI000A61074D